MVQLRLEGFLYRPRKIYPTARELYTLYYIEKRSQKEIAEIYKVSCRSIGNLIERYGIQNRGKVKVIPNLEMSDELSYILGVLLGDGSVFKTKRNYAITLTVTSKIFATAFRDALEAINFKQLQIKKRKYKNKNWNDGYTIRTSSKVFYYWYKNLDLNSIEKITSKSESFKISFIRGFYESEGCYSSNGRISVSNTNFELIKIIDKFIHNFGFGTSIISRKEKNRKRAYSIYIGGGEKERRRFINLVSPHIKLGGQAKICGMCGGLFYSGGQFCSNACRHESYRKKK